MPTCSHGRPALGNGCGLPIAAEPRRPCGLVEGLRPECAIASSSWEPGWKSLPGGPGECPPPPQGVAKAFATPWEHPVTEAGAPVDVTDGTRPRPPSVSHCRQWETEGDTRVAHAESHWEDLPCRALSPVVSRFRIQTSAYSETRRPESGIGLAGHTRPSSTQVYPCPLRADLIRALGPVSCECSLNWQPSCCAVCGAPRTPRARL